MIKIERHSLQSPKMTQQYNQLYSTAKTPLHQQKHVNWAAKMILGNASYLEVEDTLKIPHEVVGVIHMLEGAFNFKTHLHNGDPLNTRTKRVPAGRPAAEPKNGVAYTWLESAIDAIKFHGEEWNIAVKKMVWDVPNTLFFLESFNGFGYRKYNINTPYLWAYTQHYRGGKYVADGKFDPEAVSNQIGAAAVLKTMGTFEAIH